ncbi:MAG: hypothetical protein ACOYKI_03375 [Sediminibacterium sp.]
MTPKEKALELVNKFYRIIPLDKMTIDFDLAKKCALMAVDEILNDSFYTTTINISGVYFWEQVKKEIENL